MKKILLTIVLIITTLSICSCSKKDTATTLHDFSKTAGIWYQQGSPNFAKLVMDGKGGIVSYYAENGGVEFEGYVVYDSNEDEYLIHNNDNEFICTFKFDSDNRIHINDDTELIYLKSDESLTAPALISNHPIPSTAVESNPDINGGYYYKYESTDGKITTIDTCFVSTMSAEDFIESYIVKCISDISDNDINDVVLEENIEHTDRIGEHVYIVSWTGMSKQWKSFFFMNNTHTYIHTLSAPIGEVIPYEDVFNGLNFE